MKLFIASDIHGSAYWCRKMLDAFEKSGAEKLVLLGDILYHGPRNDLPDGYDPKVCNCNAQPAERQDIVRSRKLRYRGRPDGAGLPCSCGARLDIR